jgi:hypothetical protein
VLAVRAFSAFTAHGSDVDGVRFDNEKKETLAKNKTITSLPSQC